MAERDKDPLTPGGGGRTGATEEGNTTWTAGPDDKARATVGEAGEAARRTFDEARTQAADLAQQAKEQGRQMFTGQKEAALGQVDSVARALRRTADELHGEDQSQAGRYVGYAAGQLESLGQHLRERDLDTLIGDAESLARRSPLAFFAGSVAAGFLLARFMKSSADRRSEPGRYSGQERMRQSFSSMGSESERAGRETDYMRRAGTSSERSDFREPGRPGRAYIDEDGPVVSDVTPELRETTPAPGGGRVENAPLPSDEHRGGTHGL